jgi:hypothetical protein
MIRRLLLAVSFVATLGVAGLVASDSAEAHGCRRGGYGAYGAYYGGGYGGGYGGYYPGVVRSSYYPPIYYGTPVYYGGRGHRHHHHHDGISFSIGF